jgi:hypothetical protein
MGINLRIESGEQEGEVFRLRDGLRVGRQGVEIIVKDPKISAVHCKVEQDRTGRLFLMDVGSSNGIKVENQKRDKLRLLPGVKFTLGSTEIMVIDDVLNVAAGVSQLAITLEKLGNAPPARKNRGTVPFTRPILVEAIGGVQLGESRTFGFGPRSVGTNSIDFQIKEFDLNEASFTLTPEGSDVRYSTDNPRLVKLNSRGISTEILKGHDTVQIGDTLLLIKF